MRTVHSLLETLQADIFLSKFCRILCVEFFFRQLYLEFILAVACNGNSPHVIRWIHGVTNVVPVTTVERNAHVDLKNNFCRKTFGKTPIALAQFQKQEYGKFLFRSDSHFIASDWPICFIVTIKMEKLGWVCLVSLKLLDNEIPFCYNEIGPGKSTFRTNLRQNEDELPTLFVAFSWQL